MGKELKYRCKNWKKCGNEVTISERVYQLMRERGESLPERCEQCSEEHDREKRELKAPYFQVDIEPESSVFDFYKSLYTSHGDRPRHSMEVKSDQTGMKIRITDEHIKELYTQLQENQVVVLTSPTGTGKSTHVLYRLIEGVKDYQSDFVGKLVRQGQVIQTQPLSEAVNRIPDTVSRFELGESGTGKWRALGLRHRGKEEYDRYNLGVVVTDGSLRNWVRDGHLGQYSLIMIDEAHKRTLNIDELLLLLKYKLPLYPHLKVIIASATINIEEFKEAFKAEGILVDTFDLSKSLEEEVKYQEHFWGEGPIDGCDCWLCKDEDGKIDFWEESEPPVDIENQLPKVVSNFVMEILRRTTTGGILVFLPGEAIIERTKVLIEERKKEIDPEDEIPIIPVYSRLETKVGRDEVKRRFDQQGKRRRVLLTTDIAETSHTLGDLVYVVDSGYVKELQWDSETQTASLPIIRCSQSRCKQRWGRVGRVQKGYVYCLYTWDQFENEFEPQTAPEIFRSPLEDVILNLKAAGIKDIQDFSLIGRKDHIEEVKPEIERALKAIKAEGFVDERGNITEKGIELFHVPLSASDKALLDLADEQNCLVEMATVLSMTKTEEGEPRIGSGLYHPSNGLLVWDSRWTARTKREVWRIHQALRVGCKDDLDFVMKLAICFLSAERSYMYSYTEKKHVVEIEEQLNKDIILDELKNKLSLLKEASVRKIDKTKWRIEDKDKIYIIRREEDKLNIYRDLSKEWAEYHFVNYNVLKETFKQRDELIEIYRIKTHEEETREIHFEFLDRIRSLMASVLTDRVVCIKDGDPLLYQVPEDEKRIGIVSEYCAGNWSKEKKAILVMSTKEKRVLNGSPKLVPVAAFMVRIPEKDKFTEPEKLLIDQRFPVGSWVSVQKRGETYSVSDIVQLPPPIYVDYKMKITFGMLSEDFLRVDCPPTVYFKEELLNTELKRMVGQTEAIWVDGTERNDKEARIVEWKEVDGSPRAVIAPINELELLAKLRNEKKEGDELEVKIEKVVRDPDGRRGWILSRTKEGLEIPIEMRDIGLPLWEPFYIFGYSLKKIEGKWLRLKIKDFDLMGRPKLNNLDKITQDLEKIRKEISETGEFQIEGYIDEIKEDERKLVVICPRDSGVIHFFETRVPEKWDIAYFNVGEEVIISLSLKDDDVGYRFHSFLDYEINSLPKECKYEKGKISFPYCLKENVLERWEAPVEIIEDVYRSSWYYSLKTNIVLLKEGDRVEGKVVEIRKHSGTDKVAGVRVEIELGITHRLGFVPWSKLKRVWDEESHSWLIPEVGEVINLEVISLKPLICSQTDD